MSTYLAAFVLITAGLVLHAWRRTSSVQGIIIAAVAAIALAAEGFLAAAPAIFYSALSAGGPLFFLVSWGVTVLVPASLGLIGGIVSASTIRQPRQKRLWFTVTVIGVFAVIATVAGSGFAAGAL